MYTISDLSKRFGLPTSTIRYYEKIGLLENVHHPDGYHRSYDQSHIDRLHTIECLKKALFSLKDIQEFFDYEKDRAANIDTILNMMVEQEKQTRQAIQDLETGLAHIQRKIRFYTDANEAVRDGRDLPVWDQWLKEHE